MKASASAVIVAVLSAGAAVAQEQRASVEGTIQDSSDAVIIGAIVRATGAGGVAVKTVSDPRGRYRFPSLLPGSYVVSGSAAGFAEARVDDVELTLGQILQVDLSLAAAGVAESITVGGEPPRIDVTQSGRSTSIRDEQITRLPNGRDYTSLVGRAPGVNPSGHPEFRGIMIDGSSGSENRYVVDGIDTTHLIQGNAALRVVTEAVDEVQVKSSGYAAEHGGATGGVVNVITRSGTNHWTGAAGVHYTNDWLQGRSRPFPVSDRRTREVSSPRFPKDSFDRWEPTVLVGGPLRKDAAWFFVNLSPTLTTTERTLTFHPSEEVGTFSNQMRTYHANANVTSQLGHKVRARLALNMSPSTQDGFLPFIHGNSGSLATNYDITTIASGRALSGNVDYVAAPNLFVSARAGYHLTNLRQKGVHQGPRYTFQTSNLDLAGVPADLRGDRGHTNVISNTETTRNINTRLSGQADATLYVSGAGRHAVKAGLQVERLRNDILQGDTGNVVTLSWGRAVAQQRGEFGYYTVRSNGVLPERGAITAGDVRSHNIGIFLQDAWTIRDRLTLNLGLRAEKENVPAYTSAYGIGPTAIDFGFAEKFAPRIGAAWDVKGDGRWKVYGSWGLFYDQMKYVLALTAFGGAKWLQYSYTLDTPDWPNLIRPGCPPACPGTLIDVDDFARPAIIPGESALDPELEPFRTQEAVVGAQHALTPSVAVGARYVHRQVDQALEDIGTRDAEGNRVYTIGNPGFGRAAQTGFGPAMPRAVRDYDALELTFDKRMADRWSLHASYLLSRIYGNYGGLSEGAEQSPFINISGAFDNPIMMFGADGRPLLGVLDNDRTHQLKAHATHDLAFGATVGASLKVLSGAPVTRKAPFVEAQRYSVAYAGTGSDGRLPTLSQLDLYLQYEFRLAGAKRLQLAVNVLNLFDQEAPVRRYTTEFVDAVDIDEAAYFRGYDAQELIASQELARDPLFLVDYGFQEPREVRLSLKLIF